jgi:hypothetical protein
MFSRISSLAAFALFLAACGDAGEDGPEGPSIDCAIGPGADYSSVCTFERISDEGFVIHRPGGGFRRFLVAQGDAGPEPALSDGAENLAIVRLDDQTKGIEFGIPGERYRIDPKLLDSQSDE